ncbi:MAG: carboxylesterase family protein [Novosphingobium sp.]|nr:carboxylesterase family protein [Novosphingobium sp.]
MKSASALAPLRRLRGMILPAALGLAALPAIPAAGAGTTATVRIEGGAVRGSRTAQPGVTFYGSLPYAAAPVGPLRWRPPQPVNGWGNRIRAADRLPPECKQVPAEPNALFYSHPERQSEDCLFLNVWTGARTFAERRPVMVWLYGGGFMQGSSALRMYDGAALAKRGVVFVTVNYRLGVLGFLAHPALSSESPRHVSGNYGTLDQIAALQWVRHNIAAFGGDPGNVTLIGQSAGSMSVNLLTASPLATGLFQRGIGETGAVMGMLDSPSLPAAEAKGSAFAKRMGAASLGELRAMDADALVKAAGIVPGTFEPIADGWVLPGSATAIYRAGRQNDVPLLIGSNRDENQIDPTITLASYKAVLAALFGDQGDSLFRLFPASSDEEARSSARRLMTQAMAQYPMYVWAGLQARTGTAPLYLYRFTHVAPVPAAHYLEQRDTPELGAWHGSEILYALGNLSAHDWSWQPADRELSSMLASYWVNFARTGNPNGAGLPEWPAYRTDRPSMMELGDHMGPIAEPNMATFHILDRRYSPEANSTLGR